MKQQTRQRNGRFLWLYYYECGSVAELVVPFNHVCPQYCHLSQVKTLDDVMEAFRMWKKVFNMHGHR